MPRARLRVFLLIAAAGAVITLVGVLDTLGAVIGAALMLVGALGSAARASARGGDEPAWWGLVAGGAALAIIGVPLELASAPAEGLLGAVGGALVVVGAALGVP